MESQLAGALFPGPAGAGLHVSFQRLAAFGARSSVVVVDVETLEIKQTLDAHPSNVTVTQWSNRALDTNLDDEYQLRLASGDDKGNVMIWDVLEGSADLHLTDTPAAPVLDLQWHPRNPHLLFSLRAPNILALWDCSKGSCCWRRSFKNIDNIVCIRFNPRPVAMPTADAFLATKSGWIYHLADISNVNSPVLLKYKIAGPDQKSSFRGMQFTDAHSGCILFVLSREVIVFDMATQQPVGGFTLERSMADVVSASLSFSQAELIWVVHEDGRLTVWRAKPPTYLSFSLAASSAPMRFSKVRRQEAQMLVALNVMGWRQDSCLTLDALGSMQQWSYSMILGSVQMEQIHQGMQSNVSSFALHPELGVDSIACGTTLGTLAIVSLANGRRAVMREFIIESGHSVRGLQWVS